ncbi:MULTISPECIES: hypothetical protein [unclassified Ensifer]|uniref:hypothetical protein n=1 Tax=unclassified Ensifer TaxID=2633371 RepID=UPI0008138185|nr:MULTISPECIES: hypothetical protein [unclassified Ensifer]OCP21949.1 hypothetical protein BC361_25610 [Ensifer sp. LC54]OCP23271.1 hypothetical protein BC363_25155 [Ensifer sp. LC384]
MRVKLELIPITDDADTEDMKIFDFTSPENVLIEVVMHDPAGPTDKWTNFSIESTTVISGKEGVTGAAEYERCYGAGLDYTIQQIIDPPGEGWFVIVGMTGHYSRGDGWMTDDDMEFYHEAVRPAIEEEIKLA